MSFVLYNFIFIVTAYHFHVSGLRMLHCCNAFTEDGEGRYVTQQSTLYISPSIVVPSTKTLGSTATGVVEY